MASDISTRALTTAERAIYPRERFEGLDAALLRNYLLRGQGRWAEWYRMKPHVRRLVEFRRVNLIEDFAFMGTFPVIFCRNVMIYFDKATQEDVVARLAARLEPGGYLFIGHSESLTAIQHPLEYVRPAVYRKSNGGGPKQPARR